MLYLTRRNIHHEKDYNLAVDLHVPCFDWFASAADTAPSATAPAGTKPQRNTKWQRLPARPEYMLPPRQSKKTGHEKTEHKQPEVKTEHKTMPANSIRRFRRDFQPCAIETIATENQNKSVSIPERVAHDNITACIKSYGSSSMHDGKDAPASQVIPRPTASERNRRKRGQLRFQSATRHACPVARTNVSMPERAQ